MSAKKRTKGAYLNRADEVERLDDGEFEKLLTPDIEPVVDGQVLQIPKVRRGSKDNPLWHKPNDELRKQVENLAAVGVPLDTIGLAIGISVNTLKKHYEEELAVGKGKAIAAVANNLFRMATGDGRQALGAAIFYLKCQAHWREEDKKESNRLQVNNLVQPVNTITPELAEKIQSLSKVRENLTPPMGYDGNNEQETQDDE